MTVPAKPVVLPELEWVPSPNFYTGAANRVVDRIVLHRWAAPTGTDAQTKQHYEGVISLFQEELGQASVSAHIVFPGSGDPGKATQMVSWKDEAWTEAAFNSTSISIESADNIWFGKDPTGKQVLARCVAFLLKHHDLPAVYSIEKGFCRHADLGQAGGGHTSCPTTDLVLWEGFVDQVQAEYARGGFRPVWGR